MGLFRFRLIAAPLLFAVLSLAKSDSISDPFSLIVSQCCNDSMPLPVISSSNVSQLNCPIPHYRFNLTLDATSCYYKQTPTELKQCISAEALKEGIIVQNFSITDTILHISYAYNCNTYILYWILVVIVFLFLFAIISVISVTIICVIMQNQRKRKLHLRGIPCPQVNIQTVENGMEHTNKRPGLNSTVVSEEFRPMNSSTDYFQTNTYTALRLPYGNCSSLTPHFSEFSTPVEYESLEVPVPKKHFDISPPRSPAPVGNNSSVFTFDLSDKLGQEISPNLIDEAPPFSFLRTESLIQDDSLSKPQHSFQRSQSAVVCSNNMNSQQLGLRRGIQLKIDLSYETQSDVCSNEQSLNLSRRISSEQLVQILINEEDLSIEYSSVPMNKDKVAIPGTGHKNRYPDILPNRCSRVTLQETHSDIITTYINANHICSLDKKKSYIAAQGPLKHTVDDFWRMIIEKKASIIVMITTLEEIDQSRCYKYWPQNGETECYGRTRVTFISQTNELDCVKTHFRVSLTHSFNDQIVTHYRYTTWPDHGVPSSPDPILKLIREVNSSISETDTSPIVIHCSAGVGRTGCYIAIDIGQDQLTQSSSVDILGTLCSMRRDRGTMIQTFDQYLFVYHALSHFLFSEKLVPLELRIKYQRFIASMTVSGHPPRFYNSSNKYIDELIKGTSVMDTTCSIPHHEILTTPSIYTESSDPKSFLFVEPEPLPYTIKPDDNNTTTFIFPQDTKPQKPNLPSLIDINPQNTNPNDQFLPLTKELQPISFDFPLIQEEPPNPKKKNIPKRLTLPKYPDLPLSSPEPLSCPVPVLTPTNFPTNSETSFFFPGPRTSLQCSSASYLSKEQHFNFPDPSRKLRSCEHTAFPFGNLTIRTNTPNDNFSFTFSDNNLARGCAVPPSNEPSSYTSFTWPSGVKRVPVPSNSPITPRTPTMVH